MTYMDRRHEYAMKFTSAEKERIKRIGDRILLRGLYGDLERVAKKHHVLANEILSNCQKKPIPGARHAFWRLLHDDKGFSWPFIADIFEKQSDGIMHATSYKESRARHRIEAEIIEGIASYVRKAGHHSLACEIESGAWRVTPTKKDPPDGASTPICRDDERTLTLVHSATHPR